LPTSKLILTDAPAQSSSTGICSTGNPSKRLSILTVFPEALISVQMGNYPVAAQVQPLTKHCLENERISQSFQSPRLLPPPQQPPTPKFPPPVVELIDLRTYKPPPRPPSPTAEATELERTNTRRVYGVNKTASNSMTATELDPSRARSISTSPQTCLPVPESSPPRRGSPAAEFGLTSPPYPELPRYSSPPPSEEMYEGDEFIKVNCHLRMVNTIYSIFLHFEGSSIARRVGTK
jgi:hypothetical protein